MECFERVGQNPETPGAKTYENISAQHLQILKNVSARPERKTHALIRKFVLSNLSEHVRPIYRHYQSKLNKQLISNAEFDKMFDIISIAFF